MKRYVSFLMLALLCAVLLSGCGKTETLPPADPFRDALILCAEADSVMMEHTENHHEHLTYSEITDQEVIRALAEEALACLDASEMSAYSDGCEPSTAVRFYRDGQLIARFSVGEGAFTSGYYCYVLSGSIHQCYKMPEPNDFLQKYWDMGKQLDWWEVKW